MAEDKIKISELTSSSGYSGAYAAGVDSGGDTKKFPLAPLADVSNKVDKVTGKGLSTNDYTTAEKNKLAQCPTTAEVEEMIAAGGGGGIQYIPVDSLPTASADTMNKIYLVPISGSDARAQWMTVKNGNTYSWVQIGTTEVDLSGVVFLGDVVESNVPIVTS